MQPMVVKRQLMVIERQTLVSRRQPLVTQAATQGCAYLDPYDLAKRTLVC